MTHDEAVVALEVWRTETKAKIEEYGDQHIVVCIEAGKLVVMLDGMLA